jgi:hypothetical protein
VADGAEDGAVDGDGEVSTKLTLKH